MRHSSITATTQSYSNVTNVLQNTYWLLTSTIFVTFVASLISMMVGIPPINIWIQLFVGIGLLLLTMVTSESALGLLFIFLFTGFEGFTLGPVFDQIMSHYSNGGSLIVSAFGLTTAVFAALSTYVTVTKKDFEFLGGILFVSLIGIIIGSILAIVFGWSFAQLLISFISLLVFSGYVLYDTSRIIHGGETNYIRATIALYLDFLNIFLDLLHILLSFFGED